MPSNPCHGWFSGPKIIWDESGTEKIIRDRIQDKIPVFRPVRLPSTGFRGPRSPTWSFIHHQCRLTPKKYLNIEIVSRYFEFLSRYMVFLSRFTFH